MNKRADELSVKYKTLGVRVNNNLLNLLESKAREQHITVSELVRDACNEYFNSKYQDPSIFYENLVSFNKKMGYLDNKLEILGIILLNLVKEFNKRIPEPNKPIVSKEILQEFMSEFEKNCSESLIRQHPGKLEQMILDIYEKSVNIE